jgi:hypothetical protein
MRYVKAKLEMHAQEITYRMYLSEGIRAIAENTFIGNGGQGSYYSASLSDVLERRNEKVDNRTGEEIIDHMKRRLSAIGGEK